jgi:Sugar transferases involved in lipopolysaccharide synthesis
MLKRCIDILGATAGLLLLSPILVIVTVWIRIQMGSPVLFRQQRPGLHGKPFYILKFRTMTTIRDENGNFLSDQDRLTKLGDFLRKTSLDELPELINVLKGDMSLVGPRPLLMRYLPYYASEEMIRHNVRPGITGLAQISGRNLLNWDDRLNLDVEYVNHHNLPLDLWIIFKTFEKVFRQKDIIIADKNPLQDLDVERKHREPRETSNDF